MKATIIVTSYNYGAYIDRCLRSCLTQNFPNNDYEVIVVDDASTDNTVKILAKFKKHKNFRYFVNEENKGVAESANVGIREAMGQYFVRVDADDYINEDLLLFQTRYLAENHEAFCVSCDYVMVDEFGNKLERKYAETDPVSCGIMYRTDLIRNLGMYNSEFRHREEEELRARLAEYYQIHHLRIPLYRYRMHESNKTKNKAAMDQFKTYVDLIKKKK
ncbi:MAG: glycosyltransferase family 2 protein [Anaerolineales bacterium]|nr:glycosyltransferase family 2 protein [Anaerolineales bacterium]MCW5855422.1 glycosyltransferase family 2 protein [Anaerolineales bacterium]